MIKKFDEFVNENVFDDMLARGRTNAERGEDIITIHNINDYKMDGLYKYLKKNYACSNGFKIKKEKDKLLDDSIVIRIPINRDGSEMWIGASWCDPEGAGYLYIHPELVEYAKRGTYVEIEDQSDVGHDFAEVIMSEEKELLNSQIVAFLDGLLEKAKGKVIKKKV